MFNEHGYSLYVKIQQLLQVVFYVQGVWIFSVHEALICILFKQQIAPNKQPIFLKWLYLRAVNQGPFSVFKGSNRGTWVMEKIYK
jgi:hypothetical protein